MAERPDDPAMTAYEAVRAHELMLNESVSRFEHARLAPLITLNGAAVIAFLTLLGALLGKASGRRPDLLLSGLAVGAWVVGLVAAALAIAAAARQQTAISAAHRLLREALEAALIQHDVARILQGAPPAVEDPPPRPLRNPVKRAVDARERIKNWWRPPDTAATKGRPELRKTGAAWALRFKARWWLSVAMFVAGAALALAAVLFDDPVSSTAGKSAKAAQRGASSKEAPPKPRQPKRGSRSP